MSKFKCPHCKQAIEVPDEMLGTRIDCPSCNGGFRLPAPQAPAPPAPQAPVEPAMPQIKAAPDVPSLKVPDVPSLNTKEESAAASGKKKIIVKTKASSGSADGANAKACPFCGEAILKTAKKCKHCGEFLTAGAGGKKKAARKKEEPKNGALIGAVACFILGLVFILQSVTTYAIYGPAFGLAAVLSIIAMIQGRAIFGVIVIILSVALPVVIYSSASESDKRASGFSSSHQYGQTQVEYRDEDAELIHSNLKKIEDAKKEWLSKAPSKPDEAPAKGEVGRFIEGGFPAKPEGAAYSVNKVGTPAKCWYNSKKYVYGE